MSGLILVFLLDVLTVLIAFLFGFIAAALWKDYQILIDKGIKNDAEKTRS